MKNPLIPFVLLLILSVSGTMAQGNNDIIIGETAEEYAIRADVQLEFTGNSFCNKTHDSIQNSTSFYSPLFIQYNKADLINFMKNPAMFIHYVDPFLTTTYVWSDQQGNNETVPGYMKMHEKSRGSNNAEKWTRDISGEIGTGLSVSFSILNINESVNNTEKAEFTLFFKLDDCYACEEKNVSGRATIMVPDQETITITENLQLDPAFSYEYMYSPDLGSAIVAAGLAETEGEMKEKFIEDFRNQFFATAPKIDAGKLIRFLLQPGETLEIPFEGSISSSFECQQYQKFKGLIKVYGNHVYRFVNE